MKSSPSLSKMLYKHFKVHYFQRLHSSLDRKVQLSTHKCVLTMVVSSTSIFQCRPSSTSQGQHRLCKDQLRENNMICNAG